MLKFSSMGLVAPIATYTMVALLTLTGCPAIQAPGGLSTDVTVEASLADTGDTGDSRNIDSVGDDGTNDAETTGDAAADVHDDGPSTDLSPDVAPDTTKDADDADDADGTIPDSSDLGSDLAVDTTPDSATDIAPPDALLDTADSDADPDVGTDAAIEVGPADADVDSTPDIELTTPVTCTDCSERFWRGVSRNRPSTPRGHQVGVGCYDCYVAGVTGASATKIDTALADGADIIEIDARYLSGQWVVTSAASTASSAPLSEVLAASGLGSSDALVAIEVAQNGVTNDGVAALLSILSAYATIDRPALIRATTSRRSVLLTARSAIPSAEVDRFRLVELFTKNQTADIADFQDQIERANSDGFRGAEFDLTDDNLFAKLTYARKLGMSAGATHIPTTDGAIHVALFREELDYMVSEYPVIRARAVASEDNARTYINAFDLKSSHVTAPYYERDATPAFVDIRHALSPNLLRWNVGQDLYGGLFDFVTDDLQSDVGQWLELAPVTAGPGKGWLVSIVTNLDKFGVADMEPGTTRILIANTQSGGFGLSLRRDTDGSEPYLRFQVRLATDPASYQTAKYPLTDVNGNDSYVITGAYDRDTGAMRLWVNLSDTAATGPSGLNSEVVDSVLPVVLGADPQTNSKRLHGDAKIQMATVLAWGRHGCTNDSDCSDASCGSGSCDTSTGQCGLVANPGFCVISGECVPAGTSHPRDSCRVCQPTNDSNTWSTAAGAGPFCELGPLDLIIETRTGNTSTSGTPQLLEACLSDTFCLPLNTFPYAYQTGSNTNDMDVDAVNHFRFPGVAAGNLKKLIVRHAASDDDPATPQNGSNAWAPSCVAVIANGALLYCRDDYNTGANTTWVGTDVGDTLALIDNDPTYLGCDGCYPTPLSHGPMVGRVTTGDALIWLRTEYSRTVSIQYGPDATLTGAGTFETPPLATQQDQDFVAQVTLPGLQPDSKYYYRVLVDGLVASPSGTHFATPPTAGGDFTVGLASCARFSSDIDFSSYAEMAQHQPDLVLMLGDNNYANISSYEGLAHHYMRDRSVPSLAGLMANAPHLATWDDHDFGPNNSSGQLAIDKVEASAAFRRFWGNGVYGSDGADGVWSKHRYGDVEFFMLDNRYHRLDDLINPDGTMLGSAQLAWLLDGLAASSATFKVLVTGGRWTFNGSATDSWRAHPTERNQIFQFIKDQAIPGVFFVSGDIHRSVVTDMTIKDDGSPVPQTWVGDVAPTPSAYPLFEITSSGIASNPATCGSPATNKEIVCVQGPRQYALAHFKLSDDPPSVDFEFYLTGQAAPVETFGLNLEQISN